MTVKHTWRDEPGLIFEIEYKRKFAWLPVEVAGNHKIWFNRYYQKYHNWGHSYPPDIDGKFEAMYHQDFVENISESEYLVRKLAGNL